MGVIKSMVVTLSRKAEAMPATSIRMAKRSHDRPRESL